MKKLISFFLVCVLILCSGGCTKGGKDPEAETIVLSDQEVLLNGKTVGSDPSGPVYISNDVIYYEDRDAYDSGNLYGEGGAEDRHAAEDVAGTTVVNITQAGTYHICGKLSEGQLRIDLGEDARTDPSAVVTLILDGAEIACSVAPAILFLNVYECDNGWSAETASADVDTSTAGANLIVADGSENTITGSHVAKIYKDADGEKKLWKQDGTVYSYMSMNIDGGPAGDGVLTVIADNEGIDTELHLTINGGVVRIYAQDDGINTNEDGVSVTTINGGLVHILGGLGQEGDGIDSNGWLVINGGTVIAAANPGADAGLDSDMGSYINGGTVVALGSTMDWPESDSEQVTINLQFSERQDAGDAIVVKDTDGKVIFAYDPSADEAASENLRQYQGAVLSCPAFETEATYQLFVGGTLTGTEVSGIYEAGGVTAYTDGAKQVYTGTDVRSMGPMPGGFFGGGFPGEMPEMPDGWQPPEGGERPGFAPPESGEEPPADGQRPDGAPSEGMPDAPGEGMPTRPGSDAGEAPDAETPSDLFYMQDKVNSFSGVRAAES